MSEEIDFNKRESVVVAIVILYKQLLEIYQLGFCFGRLEHGSQFAGYSFEQKGCSGVCGIKDQCEELRKMMWRGKSE